MLQLRSIPGDISGNLKQISCFARQAAAGRGVDFFVDTGTKCGQDTDHILRCLQLLNRQEMAVIYRSLAQLASETGVVVSAGFVEAEADKNYLAQYVIYPDASFIIQRKHRVTKK